MSSPVTCTRRAILRRQRSNIIGDDHRTRTAGGTPEERVLRQRLERILVIARRMVENARVKPQMPASAIVGELVRIVEDAEGN